MPNRLFFFLTSVVFFTTGLAWITNADPLEELVMKLEHFRETYRQEKVHLHMDKPYYSVGDTIYFKAYIVNAENNTLSGHSSTLYVDLIDDRNEIVKSILLPIVDGLADGDIGLNASLEEGRYRIRAYTNWMRNFAEDYFFDKTILIGNALTGEIITRSTVTVSEKETDENTELTLTYHDRKGNPLIKKDIKYSVLLNSRQILAGNATTDEKGMVSVHFPGPAQPMKGEVITQLKVDGKNTITKKVKFETPAVGFNMRFFPEGGQLVNGLVTKCAFKTVEPGGRGVDVKGLIIDDKGIRISELASAFSGIGSFQFTPLYGKSYYAVIVTNGGIERKFPLPKAEDEGYVLSVDGTSNPEKLILKIAANGPGVDKDILLIAQSNNVIQYTAKTKITSSGIHTSLLKARFPTGILQFTLFDASYRPVAERLVFIRRNDELQVNVTSAKSMYAKREKVKIELDIKDNKGEAVMSSFSIAVTDAGKLPFDELYEKTIYTNLLLTSDLRGPIQNPNYYFTDVTAQKTKALDDLLLCHGWRRFLWNDLITGKIPKMSYPTGIVPGISGKVTTLAGLPVHAGKVTLLIKGTGGFIIDTLTDSDGRFSFAQVAFIEEAALTIQAMDAKGSNAVKIELDSNTANPVTINHTSTDAQLFSNTFLATYLQKTAERFDLMRQTGGFKNATLLKEVSVKAKKLTKTEEAVQGSSNLNGPGNADQVITYEDLRNCQNLGLCLQGKTRGVIFRLSSTGRIIAYSTRSMERPQMYDSSGKALIPKEQLMPKAMLLVLDGVIQTDMTLSDIAGYDVQSVEILRSVGHLTVYGMQGESGVIVVTSKRGGIDYNHSDNAPQSIKGVLFTTSKGYHQSREFYSPDHSIPKEANIPDLRSTIFWKPHVVTNDEGKATIEFYNADGTGKYSLIVEGISREGKLGRAVFSYTVK